MRRVVLDYSSPREDLIVFDADTGDRLDHVKAVMVSWEHDGVPIAHVTLSNRFGQSILLKAVVVPNFLGECD